VWEKMNVESRKATLSAPRGLTVYKCNPQSQRYYHLNYYYPNDLLSRADQTGHHDVTEIEKLDGFSYTI
jgi:hypothetical protein